MGWNHVEPLSRSPLFEGVDLSTGFYFLHSYYFCCRRVEDRLGVTSYGAPFTSAVQKDNIYGVQFHPEKSHQAGIQLLMNFATAHLIGKE
jgi:glutamine amidotransferase